MIDFFFCFSVLGLSKMFNNLLCLQHHLAFDEVIVTERQIAESFQYRPSLLCNIEKIHTSLQSSVLPSVKHFETEPMKKNPVTCMATSMPKILLTSSVHSTSFSNRAEIEAFQQRKNFMPSKIIQPSSIDSNQMDLKKPIRETHLDDKYVFEHSHLLSICYMYRFFNIMNDNYFLILFLFFSLVQINLNFQKYLPIDNEKSNQP